MFRSPDVAFAGNFIAGMFDVQTLTTVNPSLAWPLLLIVPVIVNHVTVEYGRWTFDFGRSFLRGVLAGALLFVALMVDLGP